MGQLEIFSNCEHEPANRDVNKFSFALFTMPQYYMAMNAQDPVKESPRLIIEQMILDNVAAVRRGKTGSSVAGGTGAGG